jgi:proteasome accessory factor B
MFERDKEELRSLGIPIEVGFVDRAFEDEPGYRIERSAFELPDIDLTPEEAAVIGLAARVWQHAGLAAATSDALVKLKAAGVTVDRAALNVVQPQLTAEEPAFEPLWDATRTRTPVRFAYRTSSAATATTRHLQPWGVVSSRGRWYVVGLDTDRGGPRVFRLSRVQGDVAPDGPAGSFEVPAGTDLRAVARELAPPAADRTAELLVRQGAGQGLRRHAQPSADASGAPEGWDRLTATYGATDAFADEVLGYGADAVVLSPQDVRESVVRRLREAAGQPEMIS